MSDVLEILVFDVGQGQCIFFYPRSNPEYGMFVDCASGQEYEPIDFLIQHGFIFHDGNKYILNNLTITNYDHDHFSGLPKIRQKAHIKTVNLASNVSSNELKNIKPEITDALNHVCFLKDTYTATVVNHNPPYVKHIYSLSQNELGLTNIETNHLSQLVFISYGGSKICICGDLEDSPSWEKMLLKPEVQAHLRQTNVFVASHHGHENGYHEAIFNHCTNPDCVIISDKDIMYDTQDGMASKYSKHVPYGVSLNNSYPPRKVLTTRSDGHLQISFDLSGNRVYRGFIIN